MSETKDLYEGLCATCTNSIFCRTFAEWKCIEHKKRLPHVGVSDCEQYKKRPAKWTEKPCRCEDCLKNDLLADEVEE